MFLQNLVIVLVIVSILNVLTYFRKNIGKQLSVVATGVFGALGCLFLMKPALALPLVLVSIVSFFCWMCDARPRRYALWTFGTVVVSFVLLGWVVGVPEVQRWQELKDKYPLESMDERLSYETRPRPVRQSGAGAAEPQRLVTLEAALNDVQTRKWENRRIRSLERLHAGTVTQFIESPGFGVSRALNAPRPIFLDHSDFGGRDQFPQDPIPQPSWFSWSDDLSQGETRSPDESESKAHLDNVVDFLSPLEFGFVRDRQHVAGFRPHAFHQPPSSLGTWQVERVELVGILKHDEPVVYLTRNLPIMEEVRDAPTRKLNSFERESLAALRRGEDLMVQESPRRPRLFGSIRAVNQCLKCHSVERGELLGAFSYQMSR